MTIPAMILHWFSQRHWRLHAYQKTMFTAFKNKTSTLLIAPTGGGKTLASFLPSMYDIHHYQYKGLHTLYISPLKSLTYDIQRNLLTPIEEMRLNVKVEVRTGDTTQYRRIQQRKKPPHMLLTTPESLLLLLSYEDAAKIFSTVKLIIVDELHSFIGSKRGDLTALALARIAYYAPWHIRFGLSATVAEPAYFANWLGYPQPAAILQVNAIAQPEVTLLTQDNQIPYCGHMAKYASADIYKMICAHQITLVFVNTRAQAEFMFKEMWELNREHLPIAIYHGSLTKEQRFKTTELAVTGKLRGLIATSALELGIDWGNIDCVIQIGAPKGVSRLLQRIGRSNHQFNRASRAFLVPSNCFEALECQVAIAAVAQHHLDGEEYHKQGALDVVIQFIMNCACSESVLPSDLYQQIRTAYPYHQLKWDIFDQLFQFVVNGGYVLKHYTQYQRLKQKTDGFYEVQTPQVRRRHRQNIGTIIEAAKLKVKRVNKRGGKVLGEIEENFAQQLMPGDTFLFAGEVLQFVRIRDMWVEAKKTAVTHARIPSYQGGNMPLSTYLAEKVLELMHDPPRWQQLPQKVSEWLTLQQRFSILPPAGQLLIEHFPRKKLQYTILYHFAGRRANHTLAVIITARMEAQQLRPLSFTATDYGIAISSLKKLTAQQINSLLLPESLQQELEKWLQISPAMKRAFRQVAIISGLLERQIAGQRKTMKQITFSTDLIYDVLQRHEPQHVLLAISRQEVQRHLLDLDRVLPMLQSFVDKCVIKFLPYPSPLSLPILLAIKTERLRGSAEEELLTLAAAEQEATELMAGVRNFVR